MSARDQLPDALRRALRDDHGAVRPLRPVGRRALALVLWAVLLLVAVPLVFGLRADVARLGMALSWGAAVFEVLVGLTLVCLALREGVPASGSSRLVRAFALAGGFAALVLVAVLSWLRAGAPSGPFPPSLAACFPAEGVLGLPALAVTLLLVARAYAVRPRWAGALGGTGTGVLTDGVWHLVCPHANLSHVLVLHGGAVLTLAVVGWLAGCGLEAWQRRSCGGRD